MINGQDSVPEFNNWFSMFCDGVKVIVLKIIYSIIPFILLISSYYTFTLKMYSISLLLAIIGFIIALFCILLFYIALPTLAVSGKLSEGFKFKNLFERMKSISID